MKTPEQLMAAKRRVEEFLKDEAIVDCLANMKWKAVDDVTRAGNDTALYMAQARLRAVNEFADEMQVVRDRGVVEMERLAEREAKKKKS